MPKLVLLAIKTCSKNRHLFGVTMENYILNQIAKTKNTQFLAKILRRGKDDLPSRFATMNPKCPPEALSEVLKRGKDDLVSWLAAGNYKCPPEALSEVLKRGKDDEVSMHAMANPNTHPKAKLDWYEATGQLTKYDPEKFELEKTLEDKDLEELKKLL